MADSSGPSRFTYDQLKQKTELVVSRNGPRPDESNGDLLHLLTMLNEEMLIELGKPLPREEFLPKLRDPRCPAAHNRALLDRWGEKKDRGS